MPSRYSLVIAVAKRAKQLKEGAPKLVESRSKNPITIALEEIAQGKVEVIIPTQAQIEAASRRQELMPERPKARDTSQLLKVPETFDSELDEELLSEGSAVTDEQLDDSEFLEEDSDEEIRPLDEIVGLSGEAIPDALESEEE